MKKMSIPHDRFYSEEHVWVKVVDDGLLIGITDFAQTSLGDLVYLDLPQVGEQFSRGEVYGNAESSKAVNDLFSPLDCEVAEVNLLMADSPDAVNRSPYEDAWMIRVINYKDDDLSLLLNNQAYAKFIEG